MDRKLYNYKQNLQIAEEWNWFAARTTPLCVGEYEAYAELCLLRATWYKRNSQVTTK